MIIDGGSYHIEAPTVIAGIKIHPFTLGNELLFKQFIKDVKDTGLFVNALRICSMSFEEGLNYIHNADKLKWVFKDKLLHNKILKDKDNIMEQWDRYEELNKVPDLDEFHLLNDIDILSEIRFVLISSCNYNPETVWDVPFKLAMIDWAFSTNKSFNRDNETLANLELAERKLKEMGGKIDA